MTNSTRVPGLSATQMSLRIIAVAAAAVVYALIAALAIGRNWPHFELVVLAAQLGILLPSLIWACRTPTQPGRLLDPSHLRGPHIVLLAFLILAALVSWRICQGLTISDESAYRFQARTFASGRLFSPPPPGAGDRPLDVARPVHWSQEICWRGGWYSKYPVGWPAVLALPERIGLGWLVNPVLGVLLLLITGWIAREVFGSTTVLPALAMAALSPYVLAYSVGRMSHNLAAVLMALACLACLQGIAHRQLSRFAWMFALLVCAFHVRPYTALASAMVLGLSALAAVRGDRKLLLRVSALATLAALAAVASVALFNWKYTGHALVSPHAFAAGVGLPPEADVTPGMVAANTVTIWRFAAQSTWLFSFPFIFPLAAYGFWIRRDSVPVRILAILFGGVVIAHFAIGYASSSLIGERYWFEPFFAVLVLGAHGLLRLYAAWRPAQRIAIASLCAITAAQLMMLALTVQKMDIASAPRREVRAAAERYQHCHCVVFLEDHPPFYAEHLNLNGPHWPSADVFYAIDPGPSERQAWARRFGRNQWVVVTWDAQHHTGVTTASDQHPERELL